MGFDHDFKRLCHWSWEAWRIDGGLFAGADIKTIGVDINPASVEAVNAGLAPVEETGLLSISQKTNKTYRDPRYDDAVAATDATFVIVPTLPETACFSWLTPRSIREDRPGSDEERRISHCRYDKYCSARRNRARLLPILNRSRERNVAGFRALRSPNSSRWDL